MNSSDRLLPKAAAMSVNSSQTSDASSACSAQAALAIRNARRLISGPVAGVDPDVAFGQVAGPEPRRAFAFAANGQADFAFGGIQLLFEVCFRKGRSEPAAAY